MLSRRHCKKTVFFINCLFPLCLVALLQIAYNFVCPDLQVMAKLLGNELHKI